jgi:hypothetical protein
VRAGDLYTSASVDTVMLEAGANRAGDSRGDQQGLLGSIGHAAPEPLLVAGKPPSVVLVSDSCSWPVSVVYL